MKKSAIQFALYLHKHPTHGMEQWRLIRALPHGMSELLQTTASARRRAELAESMGIDEQIIQDAFLGFLKLVMADHEKSPYRGLATREQASLDTCKRHKRLLQNIFHPDKFTSKQDHPHLQQIQQSFDKILAMQTSPKDQPKPVQSAHEEQDYAMNSDFRVHHGPRPNSNYRRSQQKKQINYVLFAGVMGLVLVGFMIVLLVPSTPQAIVRQDIVSLPLDETTNQQMTESATTIRTVSSQSKVTIDNASNAKGVNRIQLLLNDFEKALEGNLIQELQANNSLPQSSKQILDLFASATQKKVFLHNFTWKVTPDGFYGDGEFLTRFEFSDEQQWLTRTGKCNITLADNGEKLIIRQFHFEDNLH